MSRPPSASLWPHLLDPGQCRLLPRHVALRDLAEAELLWNRHETSMEPAWNQLSRLRGPWFFSTVAQG